MKHQVFIQSLIKYIPTLVIKYIMQSPNIYNRTLPEVQKLNTVVLFADISGFTSISEAFAKQGSRGCEQLVFCINRYMELIVKRISKHGGDIIKFVGDALIVLWPSEENETLDSLATKAIQCALEIQDELNNKKIVENASALSVKIGIGAGECGLLHVGGVLSRAEFLAVGDALTQALECEHHCTKGGEVVLSKETHGLVTSKITGTPLDKGFFLLEKFTSQVLRSDALATTQFEYISY